MLIMSTITVNAIIINNSNNNNNDNNNNNNNNNNNIQLIERNIIKWWSQGLKLMSLKEKIL